MQKPKDFDALRAIQYGELRVVLVLEKQKNGRCSVRVQSQIQMLNAGTTPTCRCSTTNSSGVTSTTCMFASCECLRCFHFACVCLLWRARVCITFVRPERNPIPHLAVHANKPCRSSSSHFVRPLARVPLRPALYKLSSEEVTKQDTKAPQTHALTQQSIKPSA